MPTALGGGGTTPVKENRSTVTERVLPGPAPCAERTGRSALQAGSPGGARAR